MRLIMLNTCGGAVLISCSVARRGVKSVWNSIAAPQLMQMQRSPGFGTALSTWLAACNSSSHVGQRDGCLIAVVLIQYSLGRNIVVILGLLPTISSVMIQSVFSPNPSLGRDSSIA